MMRLPCPPIATLPSARLQALLCAVLVLFAVGAARAAPPSGDRVVARAYLVDASGSMRAAQAAAAPMRPAPDVLALGYTRAAVWMRVTIAPGTMPLVLYVLPAYADNVQLHWRERSGTWRMAQSGDRFPFSRRARPEANIAFDVSPDPHVARTVYLRVQSRNSLQVFVRALAHADSARFGSTFSLLSGAYLGIIALLLVFAAARYYGTRDPGWLIHMALLVVSAVIAFGQLGLLAQFALPDDNRWSDRITNAAVHLQLLGVSAFFWMAMRKYRAPWFAWIQYPLTFAFAPWVLWNIVAGDPGTAMATNSLLIIVQAVWSLVPMTVVRIPERMESLVMRALLLAIVLVAVYFILPLWGVTRSNVLSLYPAMITNIVIVLLQSVALNRRAVVAARNLQQAQERERALAKSLAWEQEKRAESASFMGMLLHELKTPLASIRLAAMSLATGRAVAPEDRERRLGNIHRYVDTIDGVLERVLHADRLEQGAVRAKRGWYDVAKLVRDVVDATGQSQRVHVDADGPRPAQTDPELLMLMLKNLVENALAYSPPEARVDIGIGQRSADGVPADGVSIRVANPPGKSGFPDAERVFTKYYRAEHAHNTTGSGLGLYWVSGVARLMGGTLHYLPTATAVVFQLDLPD